MTILLLGGNGLLGHNVLKRLLQQGDVVHALLRNPAALHIDSFPNTHLLTVYEGSLLNDTDLDKAAQGCDGIINCAGVTDMSLLHYTDYLPVNRDLCGRLVDLMERTGISRLVHTSTANTIGYGTPQHLANEKDEMQPPFCESYYAASKRDGEVLLQEAATLHTNWHIVIANPGFMVGAYDTKPSSGTLLLTGYRKPVMLTPKGGKSFIHVGDAATAITNALIHGKSGSKYLLTGENLSLREFYKRQSQVCGYRQWLINIPNWLLNMVGAVGDVVRRFGIKTQVSTLNVRQLMIGEYYSHEMAKNELGMTETSVEVAIKDFFDWYKK